MKQLINKLKSYKKLNNKRGMTYIELLVSLLLLMLIIAVFSPMLLNSYDAIYKAGETSSKTYLNKETLETKLSHRIDDQILKSYDGTDGLSINFNTLLNNIVVKARQIPTTVHGLETLYGTGKGKIKIISSKSVADNQSSQVVRVRMLNLEGKTGVPVDEIPDDVSDVGATEVQFYFSRAIQKTQIPSSQVTITQLKKFNEETQKDEDLPFADILINDIDITDAPIKITIAYIDEYGKLKMAEDYLYITPPDIIMVGDVKSSDAEYFTSAGTSSDGGLVIAGRTMNTAALNGTTTSLNDVEWVSTSNDSTIDEGYYMMCGENSAVRRLWHLNAATATQARKDAGIAYGSDIIAGTTHFQYDWKGDFTDKYSYVAKKGAGESHYGSNSTSNSEATNKDQYSLNGAYHAYAYNGYSGDWDNFEQKHRRISYVLYGTKEGAAAEDKGVENGMWTYWLTRDNKHVDHINYGGDNEVAYNIANNTWYYRDKPFLQNHKYNVLTRDNGTAITGFTFDPDPNKSSFVDRKNAVNYGGGEFFRRNGVYKPKDTNDTKLQWETNNNNSIGSDVYADIKDSYDEDPRIAYLMLKIYNNFSVNDLKNNSSKNMPSAPSSNPINLKSCVSLPGKGGDTMYFGTTDANALINQTDATSAIDTNNRAKGLIKGYFFAGYGEDSNGEPITKTKEYGQTYPENIIVSSVTPNSHYAVEQLQNDSTEVSSWDSYDTNLAFTMGYASDLATLYNSFSQDDAKPLESCYKASKGISGTNDEVRESVWLTREFYNITESDSYKESVVAVGYNVSGTSKIQYNEYYYDADSSTDSQLLRAHHNEKWELNITEEQLKAYQWNACDWDSNLYYLRGFVGDGKDNDFWIKFPKQVIASTALDTLLNDGVVSVYNSAVGGSFTNIFYYRDPTNKNERFNSVSTAQYGENKLGIAVGSSSGKVFLLTPDIRDDGSISTDPIMVNGDRCIYADLTGDGFTSLDAVKVFNETVSTKKSDGTEVEKDYFYYVGAGKTNNGETQLYFYQFDSSATTWSIAGYGVIKLGALSGYGNNFSVNITDIDVVGNTMYVTGYNGNNGVVYSCNIKDFAANPAGCTWNYTTEYYTEFTSANGEAVPVISSATPLPRINSLASKNDA